MLWRQCEVDAWVAGPGDAKSLGSEGLEDHVLSGIEKYGDIRIIRYTNCIKLWCF